MVDPKLAEAFGEYARTISSRYDIGPALYNLTDRVTDVMDVSGAGISVAEPHSRLDFVTATDDEVVRIEERQIESGQGPCHQAHAQGVQVWVNDLADDGRWPDYTPTALAQGCRAVAGIPMSVGELPIGALNVYSHEPREWSAEDLAMAQLFADMATGYITNARALSASRELSTQLQHALDGRIVIEQAKGVLGERHGLEGGEAFRRLREHARSNNIKIHDAARAILDGTLKL